MEPSREERQQMRQRGAATRKAKEVNFGFSFGSPALGLSAPTPIATVPKAQSPPRTQPEPKTTPRPLKISQPGSQAREIERTPGSARNKLPQRPSTYEVPSSDDRSEQTRSNKRRKISPIKGTEDTPSRRNRRRPENGDSRPVDNSAGSTESQTTNTQEPPNTDATPPSEIINDESSQPHILPIPETSVSVEDQQQIEDGTNGVEPTSAAEGQLAQNISPVSGPTAPALAEEPQAPPSSPEAQPGAKQPESTEQLRDKRHNTRSPPRPDEGIQRDKTNQQAATETASPVVQTDESATNPLSPRGSPAEALEASHAPTTDDDVGITEDVLPSKDDVPEQENQTSQENSTKTKQPQGRPRQESTADNTPELPVESAVPEPTTEAQEEPAEAQVEEAPKTKQPRGKPSLNKKSIEAIETEKISPEPMPDVAESSLGPRQGRKRTSQRDEQPESAMESTVPMPQRGRPGKKAKNAVEPEPAIADQSEPEIESVVPKPQRDRPGKKAKRAAETDPEPEPKPTAADQPEPEAESAVPKAHGRPGKKAKHAAEPEPEPETEGQPEPEVESAVSKPQRGRSGRKANRTTEPEPEPATEDQQELEAEPAIPKPRGRPGKQAKHAPEPEPEPETENQPEPEVESAVSKPQRGRSGKKANRTTEPEPEPEPATEDQPEPEAESAVPKSQRGRSGRKANRTTEPEPEPATEDQQEPEAESATPKPRGRSGKKANRTTEPEPEPEPVPEDQPEPEAESAVPKSQRSRPGKKTKRPVEPEPEAETEYQPEPEPTQEQPRRKTREPRGETVPVTVYRLVNVNSLNGTASTADGSGDEEESADELTTHQISKIPSRGGVNPADVLSQICRETLEKTLNTLKDGISNEANTTRRAEWSRKTKAVEQFGSELESRLMDLSGILDSNFVLGVQLKKTKREMMDLRNHLYRVRRERENIALQMDGVRSRHIEEEKAKLSRSTISNSLHSLELALDRNKQRSAPAADSSPDLEYMLRTVAEVSSRAPGAQGGLLNQIRAFNAQLEDTVSRLER
ncbi:uncharacterized protein N7479_007030 [Penicillium vulpinum]|uniref:Inner kinetochore subunit AME1 domain-containing protein n=1 Tax=Penicillium vulpinum TaxID=29845 RepID=A0A1V6S2X7_9EURO|nr:uncharacterized protein N7479_007030 [Penicillium vulpinum]KAJ5959880.1 hypothetical protein N7479_007030 [Penicillium vulpinum]OQE08382.1 hypothetical protein PENVUL_c010G03904 [Penicillium vulpinum]